MRESCRSLMACCSWGVITSCCESLRFCLISSPILLQSRCLSPGGCAGRRPAWVRDDPPPSVSVTESFLRWYTRGTRACGICLRSMLEDSAAGDED